jgi:hypothetical protein
VRRKNIERMKDTEAPKQLEGTVRMKDGVKPKQLKGVVRKKDYRENERQRDAKATRKRRENEKYREDERRTDSEATRMHREDEEYREYERQRDAEARMDRKSDEERERERTLEYEIRNHENVLVKKYQAVLKCGTTFCSVSCENLFFQKSVSVLNKDKLRSKLTDFLQTELPVIFQAAALILSCTCKTALTSERVPRLCVSNGLRFPNIPDHLLHLTPLEERLVSPRIPFMNIRPLGVDKQFGVTGSVVNVPVALDTMVSVLPRTHDQTHTI